MDSQETPKGMVSSYPQSGFISFSQGAMQAPMRLYKSKAALQKFLKGEPKALGTVQIMIALMNFSLGMVLILISSDAYRRDVFLFYTGYIFWGTAFFIISGSLTIAAENRATNTLIQSSLAMNIVSSVVAGLGIIFFAVNLVMSDHAYYYYCHQEGYYDVCAFGHSILLGINFILLILTILEFILSLTTSGFGCKASCCDQSGVTVFMPSPPYVPENPAAEACKGGTTFLSPAADTSAFPGSHPDSFV
ncbi:membrane-spanning 4-domains subfamily A member 4A-like isoform X1 [Trichosurus vulpecula]|uniref:membrane-spanning 4-domains subfamily A member 4A-like isoform X1 n=1 Tax=Trichosurus vulpecula TaxID=9337 RepID=UPI00186B4A1F|nr:membrane-spanning 4-domains subfamily A member 4A-like isoform X1 [Trichosurus vulpecula]XP_036619685.1 membrane-spanning 4-domains subfamily A member 4A-like isoform X1 [Trichosurus vulpecula]